MKIVCSHCGAAYNLPDEKIPAVKSSATCGRCGEKIVFDPADHQGGAPAPQGIGGETGIPTPPPPAPSGEAQPAGSVPGHVTDEEPGPAEEAAGVERVPTDYSTHKVEAGIEAGARADTPGEPGELPREESPPGELPPGELLPGGLPPGESLDERGTDGEAHESAQSESLPERSGSGRPVMADFARPGRRSDPPLGHFTSGDAFREGWRLTRENLWFLAAFMTIGVFISTFPDVIGSTLKYNLPVAAYAFSILGMVLSNLFYMGLIKTSLRLHDGEKGQFGDMISCFPRFLKFIFASLVYLLIVTVGLLLLIVPGAIAMVRLMFFPYLVVDSGNGPISSMKVSWARTRGHFWSLSWFFTLLTFVNLGGWIVLGAGVLNEWGSYEAIASLPLYYFWAAAALAVATLLVLLPLTANATAHVYRRLFGG